MRSLWTTVIAPLLDACRPSTIVEFSGEEETFSALLDDAAEEHGATVHRGADAGLGDVAGPELALVYGEPNWHSVTERLDRLAEMGRAGGAPLPVTLVLGVDPPGGRRDSYPDPAAIPVGARQPHRRQGGVERALDAHDQRDGVLTAVEDFLAAAEEELELVHVPGLGGAAILIARSRIEGDDSAELARLVEGWRLSPQALSQLAAVEAERVRAAVRIDELQAELETARTGETIRSSAEADSLRERLEQLSGRVAMLTEALARSDARLATIEAARPAPAAGLLSSQPAPIPSEDEAAGLGGLSQPLPLDRRRILLGDDEHGPGHAPPPLQATVRVCGDLNRVRRCLWSLLARADQPLRLSLAIDPGSNDELRELAEAIATAEPRIRLSDGEGEDDPSAWRLRVEAPVEFAHGAVSNLLDSAKRQDSPGPLAAVSAQAIGAPPWAGPSSLAALLAGKTYSGAGAGTLAAPCVVLAPGVRPGPVQAVALDAAVSDGGEPGCDSLPEELQWLSKVFEDEAALAAALAERLRDPLSIAYLLPGLPAEGSGGSHSVFQEALELRSCGVPVAVVVESQFAARAATLYPEAADLIHPYASPSELEAALAGFDVVVATEAPSARLVVEHVRGREDTIGAYYIQDYEPLFSPQGGPSADAAVLSYRRAEDLLLFAKTHWIGNVVAGAHEVAVAKVRPSLDRGLFHAVGRRTESSPVRILAMVRPRTPRRRPAETLAALAQIKRRLGDLVECFSFGCSVEEIEALPRAAGVEHLGVLRRANVAEVLRRCDLFIDLSAYQAFGRTGLEAMACGAVPILPQTGGTVEYARDGWNGLLVDSTDEEGVVATVAALAGDRERLERLRANGLQTVRGFSVTGAAISQYACFAARRQALRGAA